MNKYYKTIWEKGLIRMLCVFISKYCDSFSKWYKINLYRSKREWIKTQIPESLDLLKKIESEISDSEINNTTPVFVLWWQGFKELPEIVEVCLKQLNNNSGTHPVIKIDKTNIEELYRNHVGEAIPEKILEWLKEEKITLQYFTDIIRSGLLASSKGGIWVDATAFLAKEIDEIILNKSFYSIKRYQKGKYWRFVAENRWTAFFLSAGGNNRLMQFLNMALVEVIDNYGSIPDYFTIDYILSIAYETNDHIKQFIDNLPSVEPNLGALMNVNEEISEKEFMSIYRSAPLFKMDWRNKIHRDTQNDKSIFARLLSIANK